MDCYERSSAIDEGGLVKINWIWNILKNLIEIQ